MAKKLYYIKEGRRYKPVAEYDSDLMDSFTRGNHIVMCYPGGQSRRFNIDPALAPMIAAGRFAEDKMLEVMRKASEGRPARQALTKAQQKAWKGMKDAFGDDMFYLSYPSHHDIVEAGVKAMQEEADKMMQHPSVRDAYNQFLMVYQLVKEETNER
jgi:hypothetical protein